MSAIILEKQRIAYFPTLRVANTSIKLALFKLMHGEPGDVRAVHSLWPLHMGSKFGPLANLGGYFKFALVRHPIDRFVSAYSLLRIRSIIIDPRNPLRPGNLRNYRSSYDKDFISNLPKHRKINFVSMHTELQANCIGRDMKFFDHVCPIEKINELSDVVVSATGHKITIPHAMSTRGKIKLDDDDIAYLKEFYRTDFDLLSEFYQ